ncbi:hypothetical protein E2I00_003892, partial [Balaenoptera physalus]
STDRLTCPIKLAAFNFARFTRQQQVGRKETGTQVSLIQNKCMEDKRDAVQRQISGRRRYYYCCCCSSGRGRRRATAATPAWGGTAIRGANAPKGYPGGAPLAQPPQGPGWEGEASCDRSPWATSTCTLRSLVAGGSLGTWDLTRLESGLRLDLPPLKLSELHADLKIQERDEFKWKKLKAEGLDEDGEKEAKLARSLSVQGQRSPRLGPQLLNLTWFVGKTRVGAVLAKTSGKFSSEELDKLWRELQHHKEKVQEYNVLLETLSRTEEIHENVISPVDVSRAKEDALQVGHAELKDKLRDISQGFDRLRRVSLQGYGDQAGFEEPRVLDLWDMAQSANFTEKELEAFREHVSRNKERYAMLEEKTKELGYKVGVRPPARPPRERARLRSEPGEQ